MLKDEGFTLPAVIDSFDHVDVIQDSNGKILFKATNEESTTQDAMMDLYQEVVELRRKLRNLGFFQNYD